MKAVITVGVSGSGKSTWAYEQRGFHVVCRDNIRYALLEHEGKPVVTENMWKYWSFKREKEVTEIYWRCVQNHANIGNGIILADTNLNPGRRQEMQRRLENLGYEVSTKQFDVSYEEACKRDRFHKDVVGSTIIWQQYKQLYGETYVPPVDAPKAILVDVDGTLAHMDGKRGPFDWAKVGGDSCDEQVATIVEGFKANKHKIIIMSGRDGCCQKQTISWLHDNQIPFDIILMRTEGDQRKDSIIKRELFDNHIRDKYNVVCVIDDRPQVVRMWMLMGLKVINVGDPYMEF